MTGDTEAIGPRKPLGRGGDVHPRLLFRIFIFLEFSQIFSQRLLLPSGSIVALGTSRCCRTPDRTLKKPRPSPWIFVLASPGWCTRFLHDPRYWYPVGRSRMFCLSSCFFHRLRQERRCLRRGSSPQTKTTDDVEREKPSNP